MGPPLPCNAIKLVDVAEMNYLAGNGEGEVRTNKTLLCFIDSFYIAYVFMYLGFQVCVKGPNVFQGYLHDAEKTAETIDANGWLHTGDIGKWLPVSNVISVVCNIGSCAQICTMSACLFDRMGR